MCGEGLQKRKLNNFSTSFLKIFLVNSVYTHTHTYIYGEKERWGKFMLQISQLKPDFKRGRGIRKPHFFFKIFIILIK